MPVSGGRRGIKVKKRQHFLDVLRVAATCAVVLLHTVTGVMDNTDMSLYPLEQKVFLAVRDLVCWCVPAFLLISGYLFLNPERKLTYGEVLGRYCKRIALALLLFGVPYAWIELVVTEGQFRSEMLWQSVVRVLRGESWSHMWYLYLIFFLYLLTPALRWLLKYLPRAAVYGILAALLIGAGILPFFKELYGLSWLWTLPGDSIYLFYYLCGYLFAIREKWVPKAFPLLFGVAIILAVGMVLSRAAGFSMQMAYNYPFTILLALCLFGAGLAGENSRKRESGAQEAQKNTALWVSAAELCFAVYLIHPVFLNLAYKYFEMTPLSFFVGLSLPLYFLGTMLLSGIGAFILRKIPPLRKYVL